MKESASKLIFHTAPQMFVDITTISLYRNAILLVLVPIVFGIIIFGFPAFVTVGSAVGTALLVELLMPKKRNIIEHGIFISLVIGASLPPAVSVLIPISATLFALLIAKWSFGGMESYWVNPAAAGLVYAYFSFPRAISQGWIQPDLQFFVDATSSATPLAMIQEKGMSTWVQSADASSSWGEHFIDALNSSLLNPLGVNISGGLMDAFLGFIPGAVGETSAVLILLVSVFLIVRCLMPVRVIVGYFLGFALLRFVFGGIPYGVGFFHGDVLAHVLHGGFLFGMFFLATEMISTPLMRMGHFVYGCLIGMLIAVFSFWKGATLLGVAVAVLLANTLVPLIDTLSGILKERKRNANTAA